MGMFKLFSDGCTKSPNPDPQDFKVLSTLTIHGDDVITVAEVYYPNCTTFEGKKILVMRGVTDKIVKKFKSLDPHFVEDGGIIARFPSTAEGMEDAIQYAELKAE